MSDSEFEIFLSPNYNKFAVECDWTSKISRNVQNYGLGGGGRKLSFLGESMISFQNG